MNRLPEFNDEDMHLVRWLIAGHQNERDEDVQRLFRKCQRILESRKNKPATDTVRDVFAE
jgi:hypothetical protein